MIDLHVHSTYSDGTLSPEELIQMAEEIGLEAVALCDHDTVAGLPRFLAAAEGKNVRAIPGIEFSTEYQGTEVHILGLFIQPTHYEAVTQKVKWVQEQKEVHNRALVDALNNAGILLDYDEIAGGTPGGQVNRAVIAAEMVRRGYCDSIDGCFRKWLSPGCGFYIPPARLDVFEVIEFIDSIGAVSVLAHPFLNLDQDALGQFLAEAVNRGLKAMEVYYPKFSREQTELAYRIAKEFDLAVSGGSDFHGANKPDTKLGTGKDNLRVPVDLLTEICNLKR